MCGIVGYVGDRDLGAVMLVGLERLSYRGYDSSGIGIISKGDMSIWKQAGKLENLKKTIKPLSLTGSIGIGHTRWATHGEPNKKNAHPHPASQMKMAIVHNGIIENFSLIKRKLTKEGFIFRSETDTEVIINLVERHYNGDLLEAIEKAVNDIEGSYAFALISETDPDTIYAVKKDSPLILGIGENENYIASDINALMPHTKSIIYLDDNEIAKIEKDRYYIKKIGGTEIQKPINILKWDITNVEKNGYDHFMLKEIYEQPAVIRRILKKMAKKDSFELSKSDFNFDQLAQIRRFIIQACGTSWHAGLFAKYVIEKYTRILTEVDISSEFRYREMIADMQDIVIAISQSGETADTLACIREAKSKFCQILSFVNSKGSTIDRESDAVIYSHSGQEIGVASTKNYIAQLVTIMLFTLKTAIQKGLMNSTKENEFREALAKLPEQIETLLNKNDAIKSIAEKYYKAKNFIYIGRGINFPSALEGALKLKEISYIHATGYAAGELKHGPIALIDKNMPIVCLCPKTATYSKMISNIEEVRARKGKTIVIATQGDEEVKRFAEDIIYIPNTIEELTPILIAIPLQLLAYHIAIKLKCDVDQPRNLAKSVTVE